MGNHHPFRLRALLPAVLVVTFIANVATRFLPPDYVSFRSWEAVTLFVTANGPFAPNKRYYNPRASGDLSSLANLPEMRTFHSETFITGPAGFRDYDPSWTAGPPAAAIFGDSFGAGAAVDDRSCLTHVLAEGRGKPVYFAAYFTPKALGALDRLRLGSGVVIAQFSERYDIPAPDAPAAGNLLTRALKPVLVEGSPAYLRLRYLRDLMDYSPLEIWSGRAYRRLQDDAVFPNIHVRNVDRRILRNGRVMLFLKSEETNFFHQRPIDARLVSQFKQRAESAGLRILTVVIPDKFTVYAPLFREAVAGPPERDLYINRLEEDLRRRGIPVVNCLPALRRRAAEAIRRDEYLYYLDDTHWNAAGIRVVAEEILKAWPLP